MTLLQMSGMGGMMVLAFALLRLLAGKRLPRRAFLWMWTAVVCRLLLPIRIHSGWSIFNLLTDNRAAGESGMIGTADLTAPMAGIVGNGIAPQVAAERSVLPLIWLVGAVLVGGYFLLAWIYWRKRFSVSNAVELPSWQERYPLRRTMRICELEGLTTPLTYGIFRPVILLPSDLMEGEEQLRCILTHEYVHIRRFDVLRKLVLALTLTIHWFNPTVWLLFHLANRDMELLCDRLALEHLGETRRKTYACTLLQAAEQQSERIPLCSFFGKPMIEERILMMKEKKKVTGLAVVLSVLLLVGVTTAFATTAEEASVGKTHIAAGLDEAPYQGNTEAGETMETKPNTFVWPVEGPAAITAPFGKENPATGVKLDHITISGERGADIYAAAGGTVTDTGFRSDWGNYLEIDHGGGLTTCYTHCDEVFAAVDDWVEQGEVIASLGQTGVATGTCLGFYVCSNGVPVAMEWFEQ